ncbi:MAG: SIMPL domain-containing protein [Clostridium sp.]
MKTIRVKGIGRAFKKADNAVIYFQIEKKYIDYNDAITRVNEAIYEIIEKFKEIKIKKEDVKTIDFLVDKIETDEFCCMHKVAIEIENNGRNINSILEVLVKSGHNPKIDIYFKVLEEESLREEALIYAILDGKKKGEIIIKTLGAKKINILEVTYDGEEISRGMSVNNKEGYNYNKIFEEIEFIERITIVFEI